MYSLSTNVFQTSSLHQFKFDEIRFTERARKSVSEIYAPQTLFFSKPSKVKSRGNQRRKRSISVRNKRKGCSAKKLPENLLYHWLPKIKQPHSNQQGSGDTFESSIEHKHFCGEREISLVENQQEYNGETLISKYAKMKQNEQDLNQCSQRQNDNQGNDTASLSHRNKVDREDDDSLIIPEKDEHFGAKPEEKSKEEKEIASSCKAFSQKADHSGLDERIISVVPEKDSSNRLPESQQRLSIDVNVDQVAIADIEEIYKSLYKTRDEIERIKEFLGTFKEEPLTFEDVAEYKQNQIHLMDKLSELDIIIKRLVKLGDIPWSIINGLTSSDADFLGCLLPSTLEPVHSNMVNINLGTEEALDEFTVGKKAKYTSPFTLKDTLRQSENENTIFNDGFELPKVVICQTGENLPKVVSCDPSKKLNIAGIKNSWPYPKMTDSVDAKNEVVLCLTDRLNESYTIQEKLVNENVCLEELRYQLQEEILAKEQALEEYKRKNNQLQNEMKLLVWENKKLNEKLEPKPVSKKECGKKMEANILSRLENQVKCLQNELKFVQAARKEADVERCRLKEAAVSLKAQPVTCPSQNDPDKNNEKMLQLKEQYTRVREDYKTKVSQVAALQVENQNLLLEIDEKAKNLKEAEAMIKELQEKLTESDKDRTNGSKGQACQVTFLEQQLREAKDEIEELNVKQQESAYQEEYYRGKYLLAQQQVEEQRRQIDLMDADNKRITLQVEEEMQRVKCQFQEKLEELRALPELLRSTQCRLQDVLQKQKQTEERVCELTMQLEEANTKKSEAEQKLDRFWSQHDEMINQFESLKAKAEAWEKKCKDLQDLNNKQNNDMKRLEELAAQSKRCSEEKSLEIMQLNNQLENIREESARHIAKTKDRYETVRRSYQAQVEELERQLAQSRATAHAAQSERDETRKRMQCHINNLSENFEQAQSRIRYLQSHVNHLTNSFTNVTEDTSPSYPDMTRICDCE